MSNLENRIDVVLINVLASSAVDGGFEPRSGQTENLEHWYMLLLR